MDVINHSYPFCWRSDTPLVYRAVPGTFINVESIKDRLLAHNAQTYWVPSFVKEKRFHNWLENARDWAVSRNRFWGTPLPIWRCDEDPSDMVCVSSREQLEELCAAHPPAGGRHIVPMRTPHRHTTRRPERSHSCNLR